MSQWLAWVEKDFGGYTYDTNRRYVQHIFPTGMWPDDDVEFGVEEIPDRRSGGLRSRGDTPPA